MTIYEKILLKLLSESSKKNLDSIPEEINIDTGLVVSEIDTNLEYTIEKAGKSNKTGKRLFQIARSGFKKVVDIDELKKNYRRT
jgi:hypothetical protein